MALPLLSGLSATARRAFPIIQSGVNKGLSSTAINDAIKSAYGQGIRRQTLLDIIRAQKGINQAGKNLRYVGLDKVPNLVRLQPAVTKLRRQYSFTVRIAGMLPGGIGQGEQYINISTDSAMTRRQIEQAAIDAVQSGDSGDIDIVQEVMLVGGVRAGDAGTL